MIDLIEKASGFLGGPSGLGSVSMTLAIMSASDGRICYGPGATYSDGSDSAMPTTVLSGKELLSFAGTCELFDKCSKLTNAGYSLGSWPG